MVKRVSALQFFKRRFPEKDLKESYEKPYYNEWKRRFASGTPEAYMDLRSLKVFAKLKGVPVSKVKQVTEAKKKVWWFKGERGVKQKKWY